MQKTVMHIINVTTMIIPSRDFAVGICIFIAPEATIRSSTSVMQVARYYVLMNMWINDIWRKIVIINRYYRMKT